MLIFSGVIGLLQCVLLPGLILSKVFKIRGGLIERFLYLFPLSLVANYLVIFLLAALRIYTRPVLSLLIAFEIFALLFLFRRSFRTPLKEILLKAEKTIKQELQPLTTAFSQPFHNSEEIIQNALWVLSGLGSVSAVLWGIHVWRLNFGTIFSGWDTLFSWNAFAETWATNQIPAFRGSYPQLVAANWSISYVLQGDNPVQFFNTLIPPLFFLWIFLMLFDLGFQKKETGFFFAAIIARYMMKKLMGDQIFNGYMDVPAASMVLLSLYAILKGSDRSVKDQQQSLVLGLVFASEAAVTKQSGLIALIVVPIFIHRWLKAAEQQIPQKQKIGWIVVCAGIVLPWYFGGLIQWMMNPDTDARIVDQGIVQFNQRYEWSHKFYLIRQSLGKYFYVFGISLIGLPFVPKKYRLPFFLVSWPIVILWAMFFTYDTRNLAVALPPLAILCGLAVDGFIQKMLILAERWGAGKIAVGIPFLLITVIGIIAIINLFSDEKLRQDQDNQKKNLFGAGLNQELLYGMLGETHETADILTNYPAYFLPGYGNCCEKVDFKDSVTFEQKLSQSHIRYLLIPQFVENLSWESYDVLNRCTESGKCALLKCSNGYYIPYCLYTVNQ